jgi:GTPase SAR1 family protein
MVPPEVSILIVGLDNAGKTTLLERLKVTNFDSGNPTSGKRIAVNRTSSSDNSDKRRQQSQPQSAMPQAGASENEVHQSRSQSQEYTHIQAQAPSSKPEPQKKEHYEKNRSNRLRGFLSCPAPKSYKEASGFDSDEDTELIHDNSESDLNSMAMNDKEDSIEMDNISVVGADIDTHFPETIRTPRKKHPVETNDGIIELPTGKGLSPPPTPKVDPTWRKKNNIKATTDSSGDSTVRNFNPSSNTISNDYAKGINEIISNGSSGQRQANGNGKTTKSLSYSANGNGHQTDEDCNTQHDVKNGKSIFPLHLIRPTLGMNLGKIEACGAKVKIMDLGGTMKMRALWERYYKHVHAIAFVIDSSPGCEVSKLMEARAFYRFMRDDEVLQGVPVLIFANKRDSKDSMNHTNGSTVDDDGNTKFLGDTSLLDIAALFLSPPRGASSNISTEYNDDNVSMFAGSASSGEGVRAAFDWLIREGISRVRQTGPKPST